MVSWVRFPSSTPYSRKRQATCLAFSFQGPMRAWWDRRAHWIQVRRRKARVFDYLLMRRPSFFIFYTFVLPAVSAG